jgi:hypothetical protein
MSMLSDLTGNVQDFIRNDLDLGGVHDQAQDWLSGKQARLDQEEFLKWQMSEQERSAKEFAKMGIRWKVNDAKAAGLHPLAALGAHTSSGPTFAVGAPRQAQSGLNQVAQFIPYIGMISKLIDVVKGQQTAGNNGRSTVSTDNFGVIGKGNMSLVDPETGRTLETIGPDGVRITPSNVPVSSHMGVQAGIQPLEQYFIDKDGYLKALPSQGATESLESSFIDAWRYGTGKALKEIKNAFLYGFSTSSNWSQNQIRKSRPPFNQPGFHLEFNPWKGWKVVPNYKGFNLYENRQIKAKW